MRKITYYAIIFIIVLLSLNACTNTNNTIIEVFKEELEKTDGPYTFVIHHIIYGNYTQFDRYYSPIEVEKAEVLKNIIVLGTDRYFFNLEKLECFRKNGANEFILYFNY